MSESVPFPEEAQSASQSLCSYSICTNGHTFPPTLTITPCPDCQTPVLAVKMVNCPFCNEPVATTQIRTDHLSSGMRLAPMCKPSTTTQAEVTQITLTRAHYHRQPSDAPLQS